MWSLRNLAPFLILPYLYYILYVLFMNMHCLVKIK